MNAKAAIAPRLIAVVTAAALVFAGLIGAAPAWADTAPPNPADPASPATVSADALPTAQIDGVAWSQAVVGNTVYVGGKFTTARPAGSPAGVNTVARSNMLAYNIETGVLVASFAPSVNGQVLSVKASPDGSRVYIAGDFTAINGVPYYRLAAISTATGQPIPSFRPILGSQGRSLAVTNSTVYVGGTFRTVNGAARDFIAAINASDGTTTSWTANTDAVVDAMTLTYDGSKLVVGGRFTTLAGAAFRGLGAVSAATGASLPWAANSIVRNAGTQASITSLYATPDRVYGSGYVFGSGGNLEGIFSADPSTGDIIWIEDCHGDTYSVFTLGDAVYGAGHPHYCGNLGGFPQTDPWTMHYGFAFSKATTGTLTADPHGYYNFAGWPSPTLLNWFPKIQPGTYTGQGQAGWSVTGNDKYVVYGGEFPNVNGTAQYGLVRFARTDIAPNKVAPIVNTELVPNVVSFKTGEVRLSWTATYDYDNANLHYRLARNGVTVYETDQISNFYTRAQMGYIDSGLVAGSSPSYRLYVTDPFGNSISRLAPTVTVSATNSGGPYEDSVSADSPSAYWPLDEASGTVAFDHTAFSDLTLGTGVTRGAAGIMAGTTASTFSGTTAGTGSTTAAIAGPNTFSAEAWIKTTTNRGGKIIGFGNTTTGNSGSYDRHVYMANNGQIFFGVYPGAVRTVNSSASFNDGNWHHVVATLGANGMVLYVDGKTVASRTDVTSGQGYSGYWRVGGDNLSSWSSDPTSDYFAGTIGNVAIYPTVLGKTAIAAHYVASGRVSPLNPAPADAYGQSVYASNPTLYWRLNDSSGTKAADSGIEENVGTFNGSVTKNRPGALVGVSNNSVAFSGTSGVGSDRQFTNPNTYSLETWFTTTTTQGGKLIGFGTSKSGLSSNYDRHVYMQDDGKLVFGVYAGGTVTITSPASYNNGAWHHMVATQSADGMKLYVDGVLVGSNPQTGAENYTGYWRIAGDNTWGSSSPYFAGRLDEVAVYPEVLSGTTVAQHYSIGAGVAAPNQSPAAAFTSSASNLAAAFDASTSTDPDGTIASYDWNFGDTTTGTGITADHNYTAAGSYTVTLTVTDNNGASNTSSSTIAVTAPPVNQLPTAAFTSGSTFLAATFDASTSTDPDGTIASYDWNFGDTTTGTGITTSHNYAAAGSYTVTLTVTDNNGATHTISNDVSVIAPPVNQPPTAAFTSGSTFLAATFDASTSTDPVGTVVCYDWNFGDSATASGITASHSYAAAGSYTVTLTVTDNNGASTATSSSITVTAPPVPTALAQDSFTRAVASGWGTADLGGVWTITGSAAPLRVVDGVGVIALPAGSTRTVALNGVSAEAADTQLNFTLSALPTGGGYYTGIIGRQIGANLYTVLVWVKATGQMVLVVKEGANVLSSTTIVPGGNYVPGTTMTLRTQVTGANPTTISAKAWKTADAEPAAWQVQLTNAAAALQAAGAVGVLSSHSGSSTATVELRMDNFLSRPPQ